MAKMVQIRNVPDRLHAVLRGRAARAGMSLSEFLLGELRAVAEHPSLDEILQRISHREGVEPRELRDTYHEARSGGRIHMATDIMAMRGTPVLAAANGRIVKLANSGAGGITIYVADASGRYVEYYAHLMGYAPNVREGLAVQEGDVIGFVGSTGNASPDAPHLHFQVMRGDANYWNGTPIDVRSFMTKPGRMRN